MIDSGCSWHVHHRQEDVINIRPCHDTFRGVDNKQHRATCMGDLPAVVKNSNGKHVKILGRSPACCAFDGPERPLAERLELLSAAQAAVELYFSFPGESNDFINHAAPAILRLIDAMGHAQTNATVKAVHAVLLRATCPERVGDADKPVYQAMGVPASTFTIEAIAVCASHVVSLVLEAAPPLRAARAGALSAPCLRLKHRC